MDIRETTFTNRAEAGQKLAARLATMSLERPVVYAVPRGGVPVAVAWFVTWSASRSAC